MKKTLAFLLSLVLILGLATTVSAATTDLTITGVSDRDYEAYKLMDASVSGTNFAYFVNAKYRDILVTALGLATTASDEEILAGIESLTTAEAMSSFADTVYRAIQAAGLGSDAAWHGEEVQLEQAYWLIADVTDLSGTNDKNSLVMIDTVGDVEVTVAAKSDHIRTEKHIDDENDSFITPNPVSEDGIIWQDVADYDIGDAVPYKIELTMPNNISHYTYYSFILEDSVDQGLTYNPDSFQIYVNGQPADIEAASDNATAPFVYQIVTTLDNTGKQASQTLYVYPNFDYINNAGDEVEANKETGGDFLQYFSDSDSNTQMNGATVTFRYSCTLNSNAIIGSQGNVNEYILRFSNNPYGDSFGKTPVDVAIVLTYQVTFNKVDMDGNALEGADFALYKFVAEYPEGTKEKTEEELLGEGYVFCDDARAWGKYVSLDNLKTVYEGTVFTFTGLDDGCYKLEETVVPAGFNPIDPITFTITASHLTEVSTATDVLLTLEGTSSEELIFSGELGCASLSANIENRSGTELPSTGGVGTTLFYVFGGLMACGAAILLVTKKRMSAEG